ncbi:MAG: DUF177 domain-containing protein [Candidatus Gracilibacteria bacterium]|nr:DUF177 domain-containing protein [Candidatus Peregrinibacteria bacterium]
MKESKDSFIIHIGKLWNGPEGSVVEEDFERELDFNPKEIAPKSVIDGHILLVKSKGEITVVLSEIETVVELECERCLTKYGYDIDIESCERTFYSQKPDNDPDFDGIFLINLKDLTIDLYEMIRQEIILHFPLISVCSKGCKGLCPQCGVNRNKKKCKCKEPEIAEENKPFKDLKKLIK